MKRSFALHGEKESHAEKESEYVSVWYCCWVLVFEDFI